MTGAVIGSRVWIDGEMVLADEASVSLADRGFTLGDGLFETLLWTGHEIRYFGDHMVRLAASANALGLILPQPVDAIEAGLKALGLDADGQAAALRLTLTRGPGPRGLSLPNPSTPRLIATLAGFTRPTKPVNLKTVTIMRNCGAPSARFKTLSYIDNIMALNQAQALGGDDAIMLGTSGNVACASSANIVIQFEGQNLTPALDDGALPGIVRGRLIQAGLIKEARISPEMLAASSRAALTNALIGVRGIASIDDRQLEIAPSWLFKFLSVYGLFTGSAIFRQIRGL
jgi:branched-chain amino acid aminotransferase